jgi:hypothetical protein
LVIGVMAFARTEIVIAARRQMLTK